ncbi:helix-turn-helix transcriptional regulator [Brevibacterium sp. JNUCC-42]|nr:helix-turn-helix transcriptional regulator [Brevibacterium sp. JNUCC-42]
MRSKLKEILGERGIKQRWLCERVGLSTSAMSQIVRGESLPTLPVAKDFTYLYTQTPSKKL